MQQCLQVLIVKQEEHCACSLAKQRPALLRAETELAMGPMCEMRKRSVKLPEHTEHGARNGRGERHVFFNINAIILKNAFKCVYSVHAVVWGDFFCVFA